MGSGKRRGHGKRKQAKAGSKRGRAPRSMAKGADKYRLYEESVQAPEADVAFTRRVFKKHFGRPARLLREDFCGTAMLCCDWVAAHRDNRAWGVDLDPLPLQYGKKHHLAELGDNARKRVELIRGNVLKAVQPKKVDVTVAFNFSYMIFHERSLMLDYLRHARSTLRKEGMFLMDIYGGADAQRTMLEPREQEGFDYVWDQHVFDPVHHRAVNYIHFEFPDGSMLKRAFRYDWRLWSIPELRDLLHEAGFATTEVYWEGTDQKTGEGNGVYHKANQALDDPAWISYIAAFK